MKAILSVVVITFAVLTNTTRGAVLHDQPLENWDAGWCSTCLAPSEYREFASFTLAYDSIIQSGTFAVFDHTPSLNDVSFTIWDAPFGNLLHSIDVPKDAYDVNPQSNVTYWATVQFPNWQLDAGSYWISMLGIDGDMAWGTDFRRSDDRQYELTGEINNPVNYVGFSLSGTIVPEPSTALLLLLAGLTTLRMRVR